MRFSDLDSKYILKKSITNNNIELELSVCHHIQMQFFHNINNKGNTGLRFLKLGPSIIDINYRGGGGSIKNQPLTILWSGGFWVQSSENKSTSIKDAQSI